MRKSVRWACAVLTYALVLAVVTLVVFFLVWSCHHVQDGEGGFLCDEFRPRFGFAAILAVVIGGHSLACALAVLISPAHRRIVGLMAVVLPVAYVAEAMRDGVTGDLNVYKDVFPIVLMGLPTVLCTFLLVRRLETRRPAVP
jgi:hypothetical protein